MSVGAWLRYAGAWANYLFKMGLILGGIGLAIWYGYIQAGWIGIGLAIIGVCFVFWVLEGDNLERLLSSAIAIIGLLCFLGLSIMGIIGVGYLLGIGMGMAR